VVVIEVLMALAYVSVGVLMRTLASQMLFLDMLTSPPGEVTTGSDAGLLSVLSGVTAADAIWYLGTCLLTGMATTHLLLAILTSRNAEHYFADIIEAEPPAGAPEVHWIAGSIHHLVTFLEYFKQLQKETTHALQDGDYSVEGLRLREIRNQLVVPFFTEVCGKGVVCSAVFAASVGLIAVKESLKLAEASFQLAVYAFAVQYLACMLYHPVRSAAKALHTRVMNSNYLVGRTLVNNPSKVSIVTALVTLVTSTLLTEMIILCTNIDGRRGTDSKRGQQLKYHMKIVSICKDIRAIRTSETILFLCTWL
jgi:hypothetical protein